MRIQILSQFFYPDHSGISLYSTEFALYAAEKGHHVEVITGYGFYPQWKKRREDRRRLFSTEYYKKIKILRGYIYVPDRPTTFKRVVHEMSLVLSTLCNFFRAKKPDVIVVFTTPILLGFISVVFKKLYGCRLVLNVQDFQLEAASSLGMTSNKFLFNVLGKLENVSYKHADLVSSISSSMYNLLHFKKGLPASRTFLWPNWIKMEEYLLRETEKGIFRKSQGLDFNDQIIAYAGNIGLKQGLEILIDLADALKDNKAHKFFIIGEGAALPHLIKYAVTKNIQNIFFLPFLNAAEYKHFLNDLDIFFLPQKKTEFDVYFPSKLLGLMAAKKVILISADPESELYKTIEKYNAGLVTEFGDIDNIGKLLVQIVSEPVKSTQIRANAHHYVSQFEREVVLDKILDKIKSL